VVTEGRETESGEVEEAIGEARAVLHPIEAGLDQRGQLAEAVVTRLANDLFSSAQTDSSG
jgi:hypothetical protein